MESYMQAVECLRILSSRSSFYDWIRQDVHLVGSNDKIRKDLLDPILMSVSKASDQPKGRITEFNREAGVTDEIKFLYDYLYDHGEDVSDLLVTHNTTTSNKVKKMIKKYIELTGFYSKDMCMFDDALAQRVPQKAFHDMISSGQIVPTDDKNYIINAKNINSCLTKMAIALCKTN